MAVRPTGLTTAAPPRVWPHVGEWFADVNVVKRMPHGGGGVMVWAGISYGKQTQLHFIDGNSNAQRYRDDITSFQHDNAQPHVARTCTHFLEAENVCSSSLQYPAT